MVIFLEKVELLVGKKSDCITTIHHPVKSSNCPISPHPLAIYRVGELHLDELARSILVMLLPHILSIAPNLTCPFGFLVFIEI